MRCLGMRRHLSMLLPDRRVARRVMALAALGPVPCARGRGIPELEPLAPQKGAQAGIRNGLRCIGPDRNLPVRRCQLLVHLGLRTQQRIRCCQDHGPADRARLALGRRPQRSFPRATATEEIGVIDDPRSMHIPHGRTSESPSVRDAAASPACVGQSAGHARRIAEYRSDSTVSIGTVVRFGS